MTSASIPCLNLPGGDSIPMLGLGTWKSAAGSVTAAVEEALQLGYRHIDCAPIYGNEREIGSALRSSVERGVVDRKDLWITSKLWNDRHAPEDVRPALEQTLQDLQVSTIDLFLIHWPVALRRGAPLPPAAADILEEQVQPLIRTWRAMEALQDAGLCRHIGVSNFSTVRLEALLEEAKIHPVMNQVELHPYRQNNGLIRWCRRHGIAVTAYAPLGSPDRPARLRKPGEPRLLHDPVIREIASRHGASAAQVLISWGIGRGTVVLAKSTSPDRLAENLQGATLQLSLNETAAITALERAHRYVSGELWTVAGSPFTQSTLWHGE